MAIPKPIRAKFDALPTDEPVVVYISDDDSDNDGQRGIDDDLGEADNAIDSDSDTSADNDAINDTVIGDASDYDDGDGFDARRCP
ncbi:hypothetical protein DL768_010327 [Monosporascus sp. mg162]|nr:hypothetical protein DL768_010327 [Monosporascus sp. mg162]